MLHELYLNKCVRKGNKGKRRFQNSKAREIMGSRSGTKINTKESFPGAAG